MIDGIIAGTGDSRSLYGSLPATYAEFKAAVEAGTQYVDVSYHSAGWQQEPTFLNKANLLTDAVAALFGLSPNATVNDAFNAASGLIGTAQTTANGRARVQTGSYAGTGVYGSGNPNSLTFSFTPKLVLIGSFSEGTNGYAAGGVALFAQMSATPSSYGGYNGYYILGGSGVYCYGNTGKLASNTLSWYNREAALYQLNRSGTTYYWVAIG